MTSLKATGLIFEHTAFAARQNDRLACSSEHLNFFERIINIHWFHLVYPWGDSNHLVNGSHKLNFRVCIMLKNSCTTDGTVVSMHSPAIIFRRHYVFWLSARPCVRAWLSLLARDILQTVSVNFTKFTKGVQIGAQRNWLHSDAKRSKVTVNWLQRIFSAKSYCWTVRLRRPARFVWLYWKVRQLNWKRR